MAKQSENLRFSNLPISGELEDEIISRIDNIAALSAFQSLIIAEGLAPPANHYGNYCLILDDQVTALREALNTLFEH